jgi:hypothetical protein
MDIKKLEKANKLNDRITYLREMKRDVGLSSRNGLAFCGTPIRNKQHPDYLYHLWSSHDTNADDNSLIMRAGLKAVEHEINILLQEAIKDLEELN